MQEYKKDISDRVQNGPQKYNLKLHTHTHFAEPGSSLRLQSNFVRRQQVFCYSTVAAPPLNFMCVRACIKTSFSSFQFYNSRILERDITTVVTKRIWSLWLQRCVVRIQPDVSEEQLLQLAACVCCFLLDLPFNPDD
jgi:hypothetical protein